MALFPLLITSCAPNFEIVRLQELVENNESLTFPTLIRAEDTRDIYQTETVRKTALVARTNGLPIGIIYNAMPNLKATQMVTWIHVLPEFQRRGIGTNLLKAFINQSFLEKRKSLELSHTTPEGISFFTQFAANHQLPMRLGLSERGDYQISYDALYKYLL